jgi:hypothetical protein
MDPDDPDSRYGPQVRFLVDEAEEAADGEFVVGSLVDVDGEQIFIRMNDVELLSIPRAVFDVAAEPEMAE